MNLAPIVRVRIQFRISYRIQLSGCTQAAYEISLVWLHIDTVMIN